jgi:glucose/arabinose dehydrogenase
MAGEAHTARRGRAALALAAIAAVAALALVATGDSGSAHAGGASFAKQLVKNFNGPIYAARAPGVGNILYVVEVGGTVQALHLNSNATNEFIDIRGRVSTGGERGLLSIAFDPNYQSNRLLYVYYTNNDGHIQIDEFKATSNNDAGSRRKVIVVRHPGEANHNGGTIQFGPRGYLFAGTGDGGGGGDPKENAQNKNTLLGKLLRINPHKRGRRRYTSPKGNPFVGRKGRNEIFALGLRNPFRFAFDDGRILIGDVGQNLWEEVDFESKKSLRAANFGWDHFEGDHRFDYPGDNEAPRPRRNYERPIFEYGRSRCPGLCAVTGGIVVHDPDLGSLRGRYLYADYYAGQIRSFKPRLGGARRDRSEGVNVNGPSSFARGPDKHVYVTGLEAGALYRLVQN